MLQLETTGKIVIQHYSTDMKQNEKWRDTEQMIVTV